MSLEGVSPLTALIVGVLGTGGFSAVASGWFLRRKVFSEAKKLSAEAEVTVAEMAMEIANTMRTVNATLEGENSRLRNDLDRLRDRVIALEDAHRAELRSVQAERDRARKEVQRLRAVENEQAARIAALEDKVQMLQAKVHRLENGSTA